MRGQKSQQRYAYLVPMYFQSDVEDTLKLRHTVFVDVGVIHFTMTTVEPVNHCIVLMGEIVVPLLSMTTVEPVNHWLEQD